MDKRYLKEIMLLALGAFFCAASVWAPHAQKIAGYGIGVGADSMVLLGLTILVSLLGTYLLPGFLVNSRLLNSSPACPPVHQWRKSRTLLVVFSLLLTAVLAFLLYQVNQRILHSFLSSADEHSCYFLAECLCRGKLFVAAPPFQDFFTVVHVGIKAGKWYSVYPPGWPLIWAMGLNLNIVDWLNPVMTALAVFFFYLSGVRLFGRAAAILGLGVMCLNPFFLFTGASYFSHGTCLLTVSVFLYAFLRWREAYLAGKDPVGWALLVGVAFGYGQLTRYLTMAAIAGPFLLYHYLPLFFDWRGWRAAGNGRAAENVWLRHLPFTFKRPRLRKSDWVFCGIVGISIAILLAQNYLVTGKLFKPPVKWYQSWERLGFKKGHYTPVDGFFYLISRVFYLMEWFAPGFVAVYVFLVSNLRNLRGLNSNSTSEVNLLQKLFSLAMVFLALAYFLYYSWGGNQWGPRYWWEGTPFLCITVAAWIVAKWKAGSSRVRKFLLGFLIMSVVASLT
ncbi:MAG: glycosyltransferase family 39 protein, partial [Candidatus Omnitrophica bacterium]|nr:glycosyltransferase family 39 protein [Candidatus Omnitrophota bacterium]